MAEKKTGAIILAAGKSDSADGPGPMRKVGRTTMIQKEIDT
ncbi:MAG TPA: LysR family transcriptional regulator, partial [Candidatus Ventrisoma faecale]|nr:LysR family transcriptional regulator [Candidatus Ventrisoma faecale]